jgi:hypothetical protein
LVTLSGDVQRPGVYEVAAGTPLREIVDRCGGGGRGRIRGLLPGVSSAFIPAERLDTPADFGSLSAIGSGLGSAGFVVVAEETSIPRVAQAVARFLFVESCNQCSACKAGLRIASRALDELFDPATATPDDPERALFSAKSAPQGNRCYLPVQASVVVPHLITRFARDFAAQVADPAATPTPWKIPKLVDFDEATGKFVYDEKQARKEEDWTYAEPTPAPAVRPAASAPRGAVSVRLAPDLAAALHAHAEKNGMALDRQVDAALREWLGRS